MRIFFAFVVLGLAGCTTLTPYQRVSNSIHTAPPHLWCWQRQDRPASSENICTLVADGEESACWADLAARGREESSISGDELIQCMRDKGWYLFPAALILSPVQAPDSSRGP
jgi:hypothetical protein